MLETVPAVAVKLAVVPPAATVIEDGTDSAVALLESVTLALLATGWLSITVQAPEEFCAMLVGLQLSEVTCTGAVKAMLVAAVLPL